MEFFELFLGGQSRALHVVVAGVTLAVPGSRFLVPGWFRQFRFHALNATDAFPRGRTRRGGQFFNRHVFDLHEADATAVHLRGDVAVKRDVGIGLRVVHAMHAIDPGLNTRPFRADAILIPAEDVDSLVQRGLLLRRGCPDDFVAAMLVVDLAEPARAAIDLIAAHRAAFGPHTANLDTAVNEARLRITADLDLELQLEVLIRLLRADEVVLLDLLRGGAARDQAILDTPHRRVEVPTVERFAVEEQDGILLRQGYGGQRAKGQEKRGAHDGRETRPTAAGSQKGVHTRVTETHLTRAPDTPKAGSRPSGERRGRRR